MHSFTDCAMGIFLGIVITAFWWNLGSTVTEIIAVGGWATPLWILVTWILVINRHPQPVDDCPCFEDSIAFVSVLGGMFLSIWHSRQMGFDKESNFFVHVMLGSSLSSVSDFALYISVAVVKTVLGVLFVFAFRLVVKPTLQKSLPPIFRFLATLFTLPNRRWYTPATQYSEVPSDYVLKGGMGASLPSVIDLPGSMGDGYETANESTGRTLRFYKQSTEGLTKRRVEGAEEKAIIDIDNGSEASSNASSEHGDAEVEVSHYDADVLTRAVVYGGIGILVQEAIPVCFEFVGCGL